MNTLITLKTNGDTNRLSFFEANKDIPFDIKGFIIHITFQLN